MVLKDHSEMNNLAGDKNPDDFLHLDTYEALKFHLRDYHESFNIDSYFICKQCGQVFQNRYKLSCHLFNVHSGKRKSRIKKKPAYNGSVKTLNDFTHSGDQSSSLIDFHVTNVINSVANGLLTSHDQEELFSRGASQSIPRLQDLRVKCIVCKKSFKRSRDLMSHIKIMHKDVSELEQTEQQILIENHAKALKLQKNKFTFSNSSHLLGSSFVTLENKRTRICFVCNKIFRETTSDQDHSQLTNTSNSITTTNLNKTFIRHMQIQHGLNEKGERLIECPVCEKNFFNQQQMERHMHTHEVWVHCESHDQKIDLEVKQGIEFHVDDTEVALTLEAALFKIESSLNESQNEIGKLESENIYKSENSSLKSQLQSSSKFEMPDYRDKHSILYCHECIECKKFYKSIKVLTKHKLKVHDLKPVYKCANTSECNMEFENVSDFLKHAKLHPQKNIICMRCGIKFNNKNLLRHHMKNIHYNRKTQNTPKTSDKTCPQQSNTDLKIGVCQNLDSDLKASEQLDSNVNPSEYRCPTCKQVFTSRNSLHNHLATHNTNELRLFLCDLCGHSFKTRKDLSRHASLHDSSKHKTCQECGMTFKTSFHLKRHSLTRHSNIRPFKCNHCDMNFARKDKLKQHEAKHINHPLYQCSQCNKGFYRKEHLKDHEISKHSKEYPYSCEHCSKGFVHAKDLHRHIRVRHLGNNVSVASKGRLATEQNERQESIRTVNSPLVKNNTPLKNCLKSLPDSSNDFKSRKISSILKTSHASLEQQDKKSNTQFMNMSSDSNTIQSMTDYSSNGNNQFFILQEPDDKIQLNTNSLVDGDVTAHRTPNKPDTKSPDKTSFFLKSFKCQHCSKDFFYENHLRKHILSKHTVTPLYACSFCNQGFSTKSTAKSHVENSHVVYNCPVCSKSFKNRSHAQRHILSVHSNNNGLQNIENMLKPIRQLNVDAKLIDLSSVNMNMLNLISIDNKPSASLKEKNQQNERASKNALVKNNLSHGTSNMNNGLNNEINMNPSLLIDMNKIPIIKQINTTDLNYELLQDVNMKNLINGNDNGTMQTNTNSNFILLNNQQLNLNNMANFNMPTNGGSQFINAPNGVRTNKVNNENQVNGTLINTGNKVLVNEFNSNNQTLNTYFQPTYPSDNDTSKNITSNSSVLPPIKYLQSTDLIHYNTPININSNGTSIESNLMKNSLKLENHFQNNKLYLQSNEQQVAPNLNFNQNKDIFTKKMISNQNQNIGLSHIDISFFNKN